MFIGPDSKEMIVNFFKENFGEPAEVEINEKKSGDSEFVLYYGLDHEGIAKTIYAYDNTFYPLNFNINDEKYLSLLKTYRMKIYSSLGRKEAKKYLKRYPILLIEQLKKPSKIER